MGLGSLKVEEQVSCLFVNKQLSDFKVFSIDFSQKNITVASSSENSDFICTICSQKPDQLCRVECG